MSYQNEQRLVMQAIEAGQTTATVVPMQSEFRDGHRCLTTVAFVPDDLAERLTTRVIEPLQSVEPDHWYYPAASLHATIKNIRVEHDPAQFTDADVARVTTLYTTLIPTLPAFSFTFEGLLRFSTSISAAGTSDERLRTVVQTLDRGLRSIGLADDKIYVSDRVFFGNITLCRFTHQPSPVFFETVAELKSISIGEFPITELFLVSCDSVMSPESLTIHGRYPLLGL